MQPRNSDRFVPLVNERIRHACPAGVQFLDVAMNAVAGVGLEIKAYTEAAPQRPLLTFENRSRVFAIRGVPGLEEFEYPSQDRPPDAGPVMLRVEVRDREQRYLSSRFQLPVPIRIAAEASPLGSKLPRVPVFSAPSRTVPQGFGAVRLTLADTVTGEPAAWALAEALADGRRIGRGLADEQGRVLILFAYPRLPETGDPSSPPGGFLAPPPPLAQRTWTVVIRLFCDGLPAGEVPDLEEALGQTPVSCWADRERTRTLGPQTLRYGEELIVRGQAADGLVWIDRTASPL